MTAREMLRKVDWRHPTFLKVMRKWKLMVLTNKLKMDMLAIKVNSLLGLELIRLRKYREAVSSTGKSSVDHSI